MGEVGNSTGGTIFFYQCTPRTIRNRSVGVLFMVLSMHRCTPLWSLSCIGVLLYGPFMHRCTPIWSFLCIGVLLYGPFYAYSPVSNYCIGGVGQNKENQNIFVLVKTRVCYIFMKFFNIVLHHIVFLSFARLILYRISDYKHTADKGK